GSKRAKPCPTAPPPRSPPGPRAAAAPAQRAPSPHCGIPTAHAHHGAPVPERPDSRSRCLRPLSALSCPPATVSASRSTSLLPCCCLLYVRPCAGVPPDAISLRLAHCLLVLPASNHLGDNLAGPV